MPDGNPSDPLVPCPRGCGYRVKQSQYGGPHQIVDPNDSRKMKTCK
jgi:hypothetical protein